MLHTKFCCDGQNAIKVMGLWPVERKGKKYFTAIYQCKKCKELTLRGETNQVQSYNTLVEFISPEMFEELRAEKESKREEKKLCGKQN